MSENRTTGLRRGAQVAGLGAAAAVAIGLLSAGAANADTFVPLPDVFKSGPGFQMGHVAGSALVSPSLAANGAGRTAWVAGNAWADVAITPDGDPGPNNGPQNNGSPQPNGSSNSSTHGSSRIMTGYIVGCQVDITGLEGNLGFDLGFPFSASTPDSFSIGPSGGVGASISVPLNAGQVKWVEVGGKDIIAAGRYSYDYQDVQMEIQNCGGYAQARSYTAVEIIGDNYAKSILYGQPFSIG